MNKKIQKVLREMGYIQDFSFYGFKSNPFNDVEKPNFTTVSKAIIKDDFTIGTYRIIQRSPEQSTLKLDLEKILPKRENKSKQIRIDLSKGDFNKLILPFLIEFGEKLLEDE